MAHSQIVASTRRTTGVALAGLAAAFWLLAVVSLDARQSADYTVGVRDVLTLTVWDQMDMTGKYTVESDGTVAMPLIGRVKVAGLKLREVENELKRRLADGFIKNPQLSVGIEQFRSQRIFIVGEVRSPGAFAYTEGMTFIEALAHAGSITADASQEALVVRPREDTTPATATTDSAGTDGPELFKVDIKKLSSGALDQNIKLRGGDTIFVARVEMFYVIGQVRAPGPQPARRDTTVLQALAQAGGVTDRGAQSRIRIIRTVNGKSVEVKATLNDKIQPGDTVVFLARIL